MPSTDKIKVKRVIHSMWKEWKNIPKPKGMTFHKSILGKWQFVYTFKGHRVSLVKLNYILGWSTNRKHWQNHQWEMCGGDIEDITRFDSFKEADTHIRKMLRKHGN